MPLIQDPKPAPPKGSVSKSVVFECVDGVWGVKVSVNHPSCPFTQRDFNQLDVMIRVYTAKMRREAALAYHKASHDRAQREQLALEVQKATALQTVKSAPKLN